MKRPILALLAFMAAGAFAQPALVPPELRWWVDEVERVASDYSILKFKLYDERTVKMEAASLSLDKLYPVFRRWNYSGDNVAGFNVGTLLRKEKDGRYSILSKEESSLVIFVDNRTYQYRERGDSYRHFNGIAWLRDDLLVAVAAEFVGVDSTTGALDLTLKEYRIKGGSIEIRTYGQELNLREQEYSANFDWTETRKDYFMPR